jgi:hypothetical protein
VIAPLSAPDQPVDTYELREFAREVGRVPETA